MTTIDTHAASAAPAGAGLAGVAAWVTTTDHKKIGRLYLATASLGAIGAVVVAALLAFERIDTDTTALQIESLTQLFSIYRFGLTYVVMLPLMIGAALCVVPLQLGARSLAFPRLAATGFWTWLMGAGTAIVSIASNGGPNGGNALFVDLFLLATIVAVLGLLMSLVSLGTSLLTTRAPGMNMRRVPWFSWSVLVALLGMLVALSILVGNLFILLLAHRYPSVSELSGNRAISAWAEFGFTQPTTLLFVIPVLGLLAETVATSTRARLRPRGTIFAVIALMGTAMYAAAVQSPVLIRSGFSDLSGDSKISDLLPYVLVHILPFLGAFLAFAMLAQQLRRRPALLAALVFAVLAALLVVLGAAGSALYHIGDAGLVGTTFEEGTWLALVYGAVLGGMGAAVHWGPKLWGRAIPVKAAAPLALLVFAGGGLAALSMMIAGFADQPGAVFPAVEQGVPGAVLFDYSGPSALWNTLSLAGHVLVLLGVLAFLALAMRSFVKGEPTGDDPWDGQTLEWATTSPAPEANFSAVHIVQSPEPLLDLKPTNRSDA